MKRNKKYLTIISLTAVMYVFGIMPANAQRGGGGHMGGGGGHFGGGGFSGTRTMISPPHFGGSSRGSFVPLNNLSSANHAAFRGNGSNFAGMPTYSGYGQRSYVNHGAYEHGNYGHGGFGRPYSWDRHNGYFYRHGYYGSLYYPYLGIDFGYLPDGYYSFDWDDEQYYFSNGFYYQSNADDQYTVVEPPVGAAIQTLPTDAQSIVINGQQYYELQGVYYSPVTTDDGNTVYQIAAKDGLLNTGLDGATVLTPKLGDTITQLPSDCRIIKLTGQTYYVSEDGIYYQETTDDSKQQAYKIVGLESDGERK